MRTLTLLFLCLVACMEATAEAEAPSVCKYQGNRKAALALTFDDGTQDHLLIAAPLLEKYGFRGTFYIIVNRILEERKGPQKGKYKYMTWAEVKELADRGHEIGNHSMKHYQLAKAKDPEQCLSEIKDPIDILEKRTGYRPITFCYPGNSRNDEIVKMAHKYHIASTLRRFHYGGNQERMKKNEQNVLNLIKRGDEYPAMIHAIAKGYGWDPFDDVSIFEEHLKFLKSKEDVLWVDTYANITKYRLNRENTTLSVTTKTPSKLVFELTPKEGAKLLAQSLTIKLPGETLPKAVTQNGKKLAPYQHQQTILIDVDPAAGTVSVDY